ncbi:MAG: hypothetical protein WCT40_03315 [Candidatus Magasanikbacteria bacterium]|jgi:hypothetical protein
MVESHFREFIEPKKISDDLNTPEYKLRLIKGKMSQEEYREHLRAILTSDNPDENDFYKYADYYKTIANFINSPKLSIKRKTDKLKHIIGGNNLPEAEQKNDPNFLPANPNIPISIEMSEYIRSFPELTDAFDAVWRLKDEIK